MIIDSEKLFKAQFISSFLATWCANNYEDAISSGNHEILHRPPVEDAEFLADKAWDHYQDMMT